MRKHPAVFRSRGFMSRYTKDGKGEGSRSHPDPRLLKLVADFLHVNFEWLVIGSGPMRRDGRGQTAFEIAMFTARDWGMRADGIELAWERNQAIADKMTAEHAFEEIQAACASLDRQGIPRPEQIDAQLEGQRAIERVKSKKKRVEASKREMENGGDEKGDQRLRAASSDE